MDSIVLRGISLFNSGHFFEAHEVLEEVWREAPAIEKKFWQGLIQTAVAFHHRSVGNRIGAKSLLDRAVRNLATYPGTYCGIQLHDLRISLEHWQDAIFNDQPGIPLPTIHLAANSESG
jgi:uncharacterized protein